jgi:glycosyltransferase involved in cell wall biosynthesis
MPNVVLEAMASRLPVLATDVEGVRELLGEMAEAQTVAYGDGEAAAEKLVRILSEPTTARELGAKNRARAESHFGIDRVVAEYGRLWERLLDQRARSGT